MHPCVPQRGQRDTCRHQAKHRVVGDYWSRGSNFRDLKSAFLDSFLFFFLGGVAMSCKDINYSILGGSI